MSDILDFFVLDESVHYYVPVPPANSQTNVKMPEGEGFLSFCTSNFSQDCEPVKYPHIIPCIRLRGDRSPIPPSGTALIEKW